LVKATRGTRFDGNSNVNSKSTFVQDYSPISFPLEERQLEKLPQLLSEMNLDSKKKYVCLVVRDELHTHENISPEVAKSTHYRNSSIDDYIEAIEYLTHQGFGVIRMGRLANKCNFEIRGFFDYANSHLRSDTNDLVLMANCDFVISTCSGIDEVATLYRKKVYLVNFLPLGEFRLSQLRPLILPKGIRDCQSKQGLALNEIVERGLWEANSTNTYEKANIEIVDCSPKTIAKFAKQVVTHFNSDASGDIPNHLDLVQEFCIQVSRIPESLKYKVPKISNLWLNYPHD
jgi:putative glycosyltransferase (TIGR04372 family)